MILMEIKFNLQGKTLPSDHGYSLYSAIKTTIQRTNNSLKEEVLEDPENFLSPSVLISTITGIPCGEKVIKINQKMSRLMIRCPDKQVGAWYRLLQNQVLDVHGHLIRLVQPNLGLIQPSHSLKARLVVFQLKAIDHTEVPKYFLESCQRSLERLNISAQVYIDSNEHGDLARRSLKVKQKHIVGYGVVVEGLIDEDSIKLQSLGMGGRKHFGCGWFYHNKELENEE